MTPDLTRLLDDWRAIGPDAQRVLCLLAGRLRLGQERYGTLELAGDRRDWRGEAVEEALDLCVYLAIEEVRRNET